MKNIHRLFSLLIALVLAVNAFADQPTGDVTDYYVATDGDDQASGTLTQPFATIQHAVNQMKPGATCFIREGVYREAVDLNGKAGVPGNPMTLTPYRDEEVTLDGTVILDSKWAVDEGRIYKTQVNEDITQLFVDDQLMTLARFPNALVFSDEAWHRTATRCQKSRESTDGHVIDGSKGDKTIASTGISLNGCVALLNFGAHATTSRIVENHSEGSSEFDYSPGLYKYKTTTNYFFEGGVGNAERLLLDTAQEWALDESTRTLYLWADNGRDPAGRDIYGKTQSYALTGDAETRHVVIDGLNFFATTFSFTSSDHITIQNCKFKYYASSKRSLGVLGPSETAQFMGDIDDFCTDNVIYNCEFSHADGSGLVGQYLDNMRIENNLFTYIDYACVNNDTGDGESYRASVTIRLRRVRDLLYRRNTLSVSGNAQSVAASRHTDGRVRMFNPQNYDAESNRPIVFEYNFNSACGLLHTDGSSMYMAHESIVESVARYNWFIGNGQRDFRWDGNNRPLTGVHGNAYRNVAMANDIKRMSASGGNGFRFKGSYHEIYHNLGLGRGSELNVATEKGRNEQTVTRNNAATHFTENPIPGTSSNNFAGHKDKPRLQELLRDPLNWDFRPKADARELVDQGTPVTCSVNGEEIDVTAGFKGAAPDIGAYEHGDDYYWIPGRQTAQASMPVPKSGADSVKLDADLMYLIGLDSVKASVYFGTHPRAMKRVAVQSPQQNIVDISSRYRLKAGRTYYWRVDCQLANGSVVKGDVWSFTMTLGS